MSVCIMDHFKNIYRTQAAEYHRMIEFEDVDGNLKECVQSLVPSDAFRVLDIGSGTGRLPLLLNSTGMEVVGIDLHWAMLQENLRQRERWDGLWGLVQGDSQTLPIRDGSFDVVTAGWVLGHSCAWYNNWMAQLKLVLHEMHRVAGHSAVLIILETLTTGSDVPIPPTDELAEFYLWLENKWGFVKREIRTDYSFSNAKEAKTNMGFFFGEELTSKITEKDWCRVPECTGVWSKMT